MTTALKDFKYWAKHKSHMRGIICHFYIVQSDNQANQKQFYDKLDYAYFNLLSNSKGWLIKGTPGHGISSARRKRSQVPCLNCFKVDDEFFFSLRRLKNEGNNRFELGVLLNKRKLKNQFRVIDVSTDMPNPLPRPNQCHRFDVAYKRIGVLNPFNFCDVVRIEVPESQFPGIAINIIHPGAILAFLVKRKMRRAILDRLQEKGLGEVKVFTLL